MCFTTTCQLLLLKSKRSSQPGLKFSGKNLVLPDLPFTLHQALRLKNSIEHQAPNDPYAIEDAPSWVGGALRASQLRECFLVISAILSYCMAFLKRGEPPNHPFFIFFNRIFHYKQSVFGGNPILGNLHKHGHHICLASLPLLQFSPQPMSDANMI